MSITVEWLSQANKDIDSIEIYRRTGATATINPNALGEPIGTVAKDVTRFIDTTVVDKNVYRYWICAVKGGNRTLNFPITQGFFLNTGPGPKELRRGTWQYGWFGKVSNEEMFTHLEVRGLVPKLTMFSFTPDFWDKFIYNGKILFIPNKRMGITTLQVLYQAGIVYGTDNTGYNTPLNTTPVNQLTKISKNGFEYIIRLPRFVDGTQYISQSVYNGEIRATMSRLMEYKGSYSGQVIDGKLDNRVAADVAAQAGTWTANNYTNNAQYWTVWDPNQPELPAYVSFNTINHAFIPVFELVQP